MDSYSDSSIFEKVKQHKVGVLLIIALVSGVMGLTVSMRRSGGIQHVWHVYGQALIRVQEKVEEIHHADEENEKLRLENAHLRMVLESEHYQKYAERAQKETQTFQWKLSKEAGSKTGRTIASIGYKIPQELLPAQLYSLGMSYFKMRDDEKAAVIFTFLTGIEGDDTFKTPTNHLLAGISWFRVENYELADFYFDQVLHSADTQATHRLHSQARLWKGLVSNKTGKHAKAQFWFHDVLDHDPHSVEAHWINSREDIEREPASEQVSEHAGEPAGETTDEKPHEASHEATHKAEHH